MTAVRVPRASLLFLVGGLAGAGILAGIAFWGTEYFTLPSARRPLHELHGLLRPSGRVGLLCGIAGSALFLLNLSYLLRKRFVGLRWLGNLRAWMAFHVFTGVTGTLLIVLHSAFQPRSSLGLFALCGLGIVVVTGLVGRYIYAHVPRSLEGRELRSEELRHRLLQHRQRLAGHGVDLAWLEVPAEAGEARGVPAALLGIVTGDREQRRRYRAWKREVLTDPALAPLATEILPLARRFLRDRQGLGRHADLRALMGGWRFLHRWLAIALIAAVLFHVAVALRHGSVSFPGVGP